MVEEFAFAHSSEVEDEEALECTGTRKQYSEVEDEEAVQQ